MSGSLTLLKGSPGTSAFGLVCLALGRFFVSFRQKDVDLSLFGLCLGL